MSQKRIEGHVTGRVQGVGFRFFVQSTAEQSRLGGYVRNCNDGRVEIVAEGEESNLIDFIERVKQGPPMAHVTGFDVKWKENLERLSDFRITH